MEPNTEELELRQAKERLAEAQKRKAIADEARLIAAKTAVMERQAETERFLAFQHEEQRKKTEKWARITAEKQAAKEVERRADEEAKRQLSAEVERQEAKKREENARQAEITRLSEEAFRLEQETNQVE